MPKIRPGDCLERHKIEMITSRNLLPNLPSGNFHVLRYHLLQVRYRRYAVGDMPRSAGIRKPLVCYLADIESQPRSQDKQAYINTSIPVPFKQIT